MNITAKRAAIYAVAAVAWLVFAWPWDGLPGALAVLALAVILRAGYVLLLRWRRRARPWPSPWVFVLAAVLGLLNTVADANAATPAGFYESKVLEPAASFVAGKPVTVYCAQSSVTWNAFLAATGRAAQSTSGSAVPGSAELKLSAKVCANIRAKDTDAYDRAATIETLTHEAIHLRGERDEGVTDCSAVHEMPRVAVKFFGVKPGKQLRALMTAAWRFRDSAAPQYRTVC